MKIPGEPKSKDKTRILIQIVMTSKQLVIKLGLQILFTKRDPSLITPNPSAKRRMKKKIIEIVKKGN